MKTFLIFKKTFNEQEEHTGYEADYAADYLVDENDDLGINWHNRLLEPWATHFEVADGLDMTLQSPVLIPDTWTKEGETDVTVDPLDETWTLVPAHWALAEDAGKVAAKAAADLQAQIGALYQALNDAVYAQMAVVYGTSNADSATAYNATWEKMVASPSYYSAGGLKAKFAVGGLAVGDALDTDQKVTDYATAKIAEVNAYSLWRMQQIEQFYTDRDALIGA